VVRTLNAATIFFSFSWVEAFFYYSALLVICRPPPHLPFFFLGGGLPQRHSSFLSSYSDAPTPWFQDYGAGHLPLIYFKELFFSRRPPSPLTLPNLSPPFSFPGDKQAHVTLALRFPVSTFLSKGRPHLLSFPRALRILVSSFPSFFFCFFLLLSPRQAYGFFWSHSGAPPKRMTPDTPRPSQSWFLF